MTMTYLTLNATTEKQEIANFVYAILAQFKKNPHVLQEVYINDQAWVARDFFGGDLYLTRGTIQSYPVCEAKAPAFMPGLKRA